ncbi:hypothetical protein EJ02DRAFT_126732 [Clathrospora elynae]|uniref:Uncharacterized protein n=1 Tax=Clathrospora elynae TaxID=706981 RepID=A0A6A5SVE5_9PLEO|nr:hypothetical protein EJ02DRAFT_126732 [Clathrospora elynae]
MATKRIPTVVVEKAPRMKTMLSVSKLLFTPAKSSRIEAKGIAALRLPTPYAKLETTIHSFDGTFAYTSTRATKSAGNCVSIDADGNALIATEYFFGPSKDPMLERLGVEDQDSPKMDVTDLQLPFSRWPHTCLDI